MSEFYYFVQFFFIYGFLGWCTEVAFAAWKERTFVNRGFLNGPICPIYGFGVCSVVYLLKPFESNFILLYISSVILVSALEWLTGFLLEKLFHHKWWDYSNMPLNLNGYICLLFSLIWGVFCVAIVSVIHPFIQRCVFRLPVTLTMVVLVILSISMFADHYITASEILKLNKRLAKMQEIADELHEISDKIGENIYKSTITAIGKEEDLKVSISTKQEELTDTLDGITDEVKERITVLRSKFRSIETGLPVTQRRIVKAFPNMQSRSYKEMLEEIRKKLPTIKK